MFARVLLPSILAISIFLFTGCAGKPADQQKETGDPAVSETKKSIFQGSCDAMINEAASEARATMRIVTKACQDKSIEATPVWGLNYKGAVHIRVFDKNGMQIEDRYDNP